MTQSSGEGRKKMAARLRSLRDKILSDWESLVRNTVPGDAGLSKSLLRDSLHLLLENLAGALEDDDWSYHAAKNVEIALEHGLQRYHIHGHAFDQVVDEYAQLRKALIRNVAADAPALGVEVIHAFIDASVKHAGGYFVELRNRDEKRALAAARDRARDQRDGLEDERDSIRMYATALEQERQLRSEVISMLGHDMRTPLTAALLAAEMLARNPDNLAKNPQKLERIIEGLQRLNAMIKNLLDADRLRTGTSHPIEVDACDLAEVMHRAQRELAAVHGQRFTTHTPTQLPGYWDSVALQRVVENLASNAVKYGSPADSILLELTQQGDGVQIRVHNSGKPIPPEALPSLFTPRFRTDEAGRSAVTGWGLGLALVKAVAEAHGGSVAVHSSPADGTSFYVRLPTDCREAQSPHEAASHVAHPTL